jgi:hypothetical protein
MSATEHIWTIEEFIVSTPFCQRRGRPDARLPLSAQQRFTVFADRF